MEQNSLVLSGRSRSGFAAAVAILALACTACTAPSQDPERVTADILGVINYVETQATGGSGVIRTSCKTKVWRGPATSSWISKQPVLGLYAKGDRSAAIDVLHLAGDDMGVAIDRDLQRLRKPGSSTEPSTSPVWPFAQVSLRTSQEYAGQRKYNSRSGLLKAPFLLRSIIANLGPPKFAYNPGCDGTIVLLYGDAIDPHRDLYFSTPTIEAVGAMTGRPAKRVPTQCFSDRNFIMISIFDGLYAVQSKEICSNVGR
jgi:hypothetical protein